MDPVACWKELAAALEAGDREAIYDNAESLRDWLRGGGFAPLNSADMPDRRTFVRYLTDIMQATKAR